jgi:universal stress protein E
MNPIRNILVIVDPTASVHPAIDKAAVLAERFSARLDLFVCDTKAAWNIRHAQYASDPGRGAPLAHLKPLVEGLAEPLRKRGIDVTTEATSADPLAAALLERVKHTCAELVVKDTHHHTVAHRTILTNTDWELIRGCPVSLLLTKPRIWSSNPTICAAVDPGHRDDKPVLLDRCILDLASTVANKLRGRLHVLHAYIPMAMIATAVGSLPPMVMDVSPEQLANERTNKQKELTALVSDYDLPSENLHLEVGGTRDVLCRMAHQLNADVMTMGAISRSAVKRVFVGSTAEMVLEHLPCDALVVKSPNFAELLAV